LAEGSRIDAGAAANRVDITAVAGNMIRDAGSGGGKNTRDRLVEARPHAGRVTLFANRDKSSR
jgi:hypothetical protein